MSKSAYFNKEAQDALVAGINLVGNAVKTTLGAAGRTVVIAREDKAPVITKDGVSVAREIAPKDEKVKLGADLAISVAQKQMDAVGDGTTTATVLAQAIVNAGVRQIELSENEVNRTALRYGIEKAKDYVIEQLNNAAVAISTDEQLNQIATVSANGDEKLGSIIAEAYRKVTKDGVVTVEETKARDISLSIREGMTFDRGWTSQFFITNQESQTAEFDNPYILLCNSKISNFSTLANVIKDVVQAQKPLVIIAESFDNTVIQGLAMNIVRSGGQLKIACVEAPGYGARRLDILRDMAIYLDAEVADDPMSMTLEEMSSAAFGRCEKVIIKKDETIIRGGVGNPDLIAKRIEAIKGEINACKENDTFEKEQLGKRLGSLTNGIAVIQVGGSSETEIKELRDRLEDAQYAVKAALEEGYLPGGGATLLHISKNAKAVLKSDNPDEQMGIDIFVNALKAPFNTILDNAGVHYDTIAQEVLDTQNINMGYNVKTLKISNLIEDGILDPAKVVKGTVYAASSIAGVALTSSVIICEDPEENKGLALNMMPGMM